MAETTKPHAPTLLAIADSAMGCASQPAIDGFAASDALKAFSQVLRTQAERYSTPAPGLAAQDREDWPYSPHAVVIDTDGTAMVQCPGCGFRWDERTSDRPPARAGMAEGGEVLDQHTVEKASVEASPKDAKSAVVDAPASPPTSSPDTGLLPCPFCGGPAELHEREATTDMAICCCLCSAVVTRLGISELVRERAIAAWNHRASPGMAAAADCTDDHTGAEPPPAASGQDSYGNCFECNAPLFKPSPSRGPVCIVCNPSMLGDDRYVVRPAQEGLSAEWRKGRTVDNPRQIGERVDRNELGDRMADALDRKDAEIEGLKRQIVNERLEGNAVIAQYKRETEAAERELAGARRVVEDAANRVRWLLPLAKGYAATHAVGGNINIVLEAEQFLASIPAQKEGE